MRRGRGSRSDARSRWREVRASRKRRRYNDERDFLLWFFFVFFCSALGTDLWRSTRCDDTHVRYSETHVYSAKMHPRLTYNPFDLE